MESSPVKSPQDSPRKGVVGSIGNLFKEVRGNALWDLTKWILKNIAPPLLLTNIFGYIGLGLFYFRIIPSEIWVMVSFGIVWTLFQPIAFFLLRKRWISQASIRESELEKQLEELRHEKEESDYKRTLENAKSHSDSIVATAEYLREYQLLKEEKEEVEKTLRENKWLLERVEEQAVAISDYVLLERFFFSSLREKPIPTAHFIFLLRNNSLFDVSVDKKIDGYIQFYGTELLGEKRFSSPPDSIPPTDFKWFNFEYRLSKEEFNLIVENDRPGEFLFDVSKLVVKLKGYGIKTQNVKIPNRYRVYRYDDYRADLDKYEKKVY
ncbi:MAG: hypothetical protein DMF63_02445 [Acidobacteria bacterium]|nr:MAG: hypothetical protein DMF63_02445 [Acidobacteriota bacterium]